MEKSINEFAEKYGFQSKNTAFKKSKMTTTYPPVKYFESCDRYLAATDEVIDDEGNYHRCYYGTGDRLFVETD